MEGQPSRMWPIGLGIAGGLVMVFAVAGLLGWRALTRFFLRQYYEGNYHPLELTTEEVGDYPAEHLLDNVPWIATRETLCQSNSLQMIAAQQGIEQPRRYFDFLMGFTYGASEIPGGLGFFPGTDPETGFVVAAPYLGLIRRYYVTDDEALYLDALRYYLAQGFPVRVGLDYGKLHDMEEGAPHSDLLVGYDGAGFHYYETVCIPPAPCQPGYLAPGERGLHVPDDKLLEAVRDQAEMLEYPWRYSLSIFETGPLEQDLRPIWTRNGRSLIGGAQYGPRQGADVVDGLATEIEKRGTSIDATEIRPGLEVAVCVRQENADYLREAFSGNADLEQAAGLFDRASGNYQAVLDAIEDGVGDRAEAEQIATWLRDAAAAEREVGEIFVTRGK